MSTYRSAGKLLAGAPVFHKFPSENLVATLKTHNLTNYTDYELYVVLPDNMEQLVLEIDKGEVTYGELLYDQVVKTNIINFPAVVTEIIAKSSTDEKYPHRKYTIKKEALAQ